MLRRFARKRRYPFRRRFFKRAPFSIVPSTVRSLRPHTLYFDSALTSSFNSVGNSGTLLSITASLDFGDSDAERQSNDLYFKSFQLHGVLEAGDDTNIFRICVYAATLNQSGPNSIDFKIHPGYNCCTQVFYDRWFYLVHNVAADSYQLTLRVVNISVPLRFKALYRADDDSTPSLYLFMCSDSAAIAHPGFTCGRYKITFAN